MSTVREEERVTFQLFSPMRDLEKLEVEYKIFKYSLHFQQAVFVSALSF